MKNTKWLIFFITAFLLVSCEKKQNLFEKAFEGKSFEQHATSQEESSEEPIEEEVKKKVESQVLVRDGFEEQPVESVFLPEKTVKRDYISPFKVDPDAPQINLEEAKLYDLIHSLCEIMKVNYIIDPSVSDQTITIGMVEGEIKMKTSELFDLLLKLHDLTWVKEAGFVRIVPLGSPDIMPGLNMLYGTKSNKYLFQEELAMQIIPLKYVTPGDMSNVIKGFLSPSAQVLEEPIHNAIIIIDKAHFLRKVMEIIPLFDVSALYNKKMVLYNLSFVGCADMAPQLESILSAYGYSTEAEQISIHPIEALNSLLVISTFREVFDEISFWLEKLDQEAQFEEPTIFVYNVQHTTASILAGTISSLLGIAGGSTGGSASRSASQRRTTNPTGDSAASNTAQNIGGSMAPSANQNANQQGGQPMIVDSENNSLIFHTTPKEYQKIKKILEKLDILPRQVFLEVTIFKVNLTNAYTLGFDWTGRSGVSQLTEGATGTINNRNLTLGSSGLGFSYSFTGLTELLSVSLNAAKQKGIATILQQPHMMAIDNKAASISIGQDIPIITQRTTLPGQTSDPVYQPYTSANTQYRKTGVAMTVTPHINANGLIRMEIELSISSPGSSGDANTPPPISQNDLSTEMIVRDGQTVVMGGMISDTETDDKQGVPFLSKVPLFKHLFNKTTKSNGRDELIVMITPKVIDNEADSIEVSRQFSEKIKKEYLNFSLD